MLETFCIVITQVAILFIMMGVGFFLCKKEILNDTVRNGATTILLNIVTPCLLINEMQTERTESRIAGLGFVLLFSASYFILFSVFAALITLKNRKNEKARASQRICSVYPNCGFMGIPLLASLTSIVGSDAVFYCSAIIGVYNFFIFTHGISLFNTEKEKKGILDTLKKIISPAVISVIIGMLLFFFNISLPPVIARPIAYLGSMNTPLAMLIIGAIIARCNILTAFRNKHIYLPVILRNFVFPLIFLGICLLSRKLLAPNIDSVLLICIVILSCPVAGNCAIFSERYGGDRELASGAFSLSTLLSIITIPLIVTLATSIL